MVILHYKEVACPFHRSSFSTEDKSESQVREIGNPNPHKFEILSCEQ